VSLLALRERKECDDEEEESYTNRISRYISSCSSLVGSADKWSITNSSGNDKRENENYQCARYISGSEKGN